MGLISRVSSRTYRLVSMKRSNGQITADTLQPAGSSTAKPLKFSRQLTKVQDQDELNNNVLQFQVNKLTSLITELSDHIESLKADVEFYKRKKREVVANVNRGAAAVKSALAVKSTNKFNRAE